MDQLVHQIPLKSMIGWINPPNIQYWCDQITLLGPIDHKFGAIDSHDPLLWLKDKLSHEKFPVCFFLFPHLALSEII